MSHICLCVSHISFVTRLDGRCAENKVNLILTNGEKCKDVK